MSASDSIQTQKDIFGQIQGLLAFLDSTDEKKSRENLEAWKNTLESLREITSNPLPFLLELLKVLKQKKSNKKEGAKAKKMRAAKRKKRRGQKNKTEDGKFKETKKSFAEKFHLDVSADVWLRVLNKIIRESIIATIPKIDDILFEEIIAAFNCDLSMLVPVDGDGLNGPIVLNISQVDQLKQLFNDPASDVGKFMYEQFPLSGSLYPPGPVSYPVNRFLRDITFNGGVSVVAGGPGVPGNKQTIYGRSGRALFDIEALNNQFTIWPYYKDEPGNAQYVSAPALVNATQGPIVGATKFTFVELLKDYFGNVRLIEIQNFLGALMEILTGFMSVRNKNFSIEDMLGLQKLMASVNKMLESCDGMDMHTSTDAVNALSELHDDDSFFEFTAEESRNIDIEVQKKSQNVISLLSCGVVDIPVDNEILDEGVDSILASFNQDEQMKEFDLVLQKFAATSAKKYGFEIDLGSISLPAEIDFKENLIKKLPQILLYCVLNPKAVLPIVLTAKLLNQNGAIPSGIDMFAKIFKRVIIRVVKAFLAEVAKRILALVKEILLRYIRDLIKRKLDEMNKKKVRMIAKLIEILFPLIIALQEAKTCKEIYNILLAALAANMPDIPFGVPPFLVSAAKLRPGTSALGTFEKLIDKLQDHGIPIGDMPDGSPNLFMLSQFSLIQAQEDEKTDNAAGQGVIVEGQVINAFGGGIIKPFTRTDVIIK
tara:strand:- start:2967 stop:5102 length:2136 start_codon:yes stop_codon:yes gene_type:complete